TEPYYLQANSSALNRFLVTQLRHAGGFQFIPGRLQKPVQKDGGALLVTLEKQQPRRFDRVVVRHGPPPALKVFEGVWQACTPLRDLWKRSPHLLDQTRERNWKEGAFGPEERFESIDAQPVPAGVGEGPPAAVASAPVSPAVGAPAVVAAA